MLAVAGGGALHLVLPVTILVCERGRVTRTEKDGKTTVMADHLNTPKDLVYAIDGSIYFSDTAGSAIYQITRHGEVRVVSRDCESPKGVALAPNQQRLYAADMGRQNIWVFEIARDGVLSNGMVFAPAHAHGLKTDEMGNVWAADEHSIAIFDAQGHGLGEIPVPEDPNNCAWGDGLEISI